MSVVANLGFFIVSWGVLLDVAGGDMLDDGAIGHACTQARLGRYEPCDIHWIDEEVECLMEIWEEG